MFWVISNPWKAQVYKTEPANKKEKDRQTQKNRIFNQERKAQNLMSGGMD